mgnify:CR=1 FL=1
MADDGAYVDDPDLMLEDDEDFLLSAPQDAEEVLDVDASVRSHIVHCGWWLWGVGEGWGLLCEPPPLKLLPTHVPSPAALCSTNAACSEARSTFDHQHH